MKFIPTALTLSLILALTACSSSGSSDSSNQNPISNPPEKDINSPSEKPQLILNGEKLVTTKQNLVMLEGEQATINQEIGLIKTAISSKNKKIAVLFKARKNNTKETFNPYMSLDNVTLTNKLINLNDKSKVLKNKIATKNKELENNKINFNDSIKDLSEKEKLTQQVLKYNQFYNRADQEELRLKQNIANAYVQYIKDKNSAINTITLFEAIYALNNYQDTWREAYQGADKYNRELGELEGNALSKFGFNSLHSPIPNGAKIVKYKLDPKKANFEGQLGLLLAGDGINNSNASTKANNQQANLNHFFLTQKDFEQGKGIAFAKDGEEIGVLDNGAQVNVIENGDNLIRNTFFSYDNIQFGEFDQITENGKEVENSSRSYAIFNKTPAKVVNAQTGKAIFNGDGIGTLHNENIDLGYYPVMHKVKIIADYDKNTMEGKIFNINSPKDDLAVYQKANAVPKEFEFKANIDKDGLATNGPKDRNDIMIYHAGAKGEELAVGYDLHKENWNIKGVAGAKKEQSATKK